ncbi:MAG: hydratase [Clostridiales bacterium GWF2_38_85]|nr:MAG: hydratase [Clostridiales bacterium GWF2_38_85]HBL83732.1 hydratase [Clostridiales bacterium]
MIKLMNGCFYYKGELYENDEQLKAATSEEITPEAARKNTIAYRILQYHNKSGNDQKLKIKFDALASHDITYVGIIENAKAGGLEKFPVPYILTNCHNSLCAVGGTINEDDHVYGLSAAKKYGGIYVPAHIAVIHSFMREYFAGGGKMILGSDSHTRYGALGCMAIGEGGPELVKQLLNATYDITMPEVVAVRLTGTLRHGVGPHDVALAIIGKVYGNEFVKNKVMEFIGDGIANLSMEFRNGIDVMTTETTCLSSIWITDEKTKQYLKIHNRIGDYKKTEPKGVAYYDAVVDVNLSEIEPMIALPFHPSNAYTIREFQANTAEILDNVEKYCIEKLGVSIDLKYKITKDGYKVEQGVIAGCAGGIYDNICTAATILRGKNIGTDFSLSIYPASQPAYSALVQSGVVNTIFETGATMRTAFCGPCFGAGDVPANGNLSIRHTTRNFPNREGSKPSEGQIAAVALMDARSIAATAVNDGIITGADTIEYIEFIPEYKFNAKIYENRIYNGFGKSESEKPLIYGPNITGIPTLEPIRDHLLLKMAAVIHDPVTTTDELIPSGEASSYRSNPLKLAQLTLSRKAPKFVEETKKIIGTEGYLRALNAAKILLGMDASINIGSVLYAKKPGDGSAREQAASSQRFLGTLANIASVYATKRYRSNLINWGMLPFTSSFDDFKVGDYVLIPDIKQALINGLLEVSAFIINEGEPHRITLKLQNMTDEEREIILAGCLINTYKKKS